LTKEYGKISCFYKKSDWIGSSWDILTLLIERKDGVNILKSAESKMSIHFHTPSYLFLLSFLWILKILYEFLGESDRHEWLFNDYKEFIKHIGLSDDQRIQDIILFQIRILKRLGFMNGTDLEAWGNIGRYIYEYIDTKNIQLILSGKNLDTPMIQFLQNLVYKTVYQAIL
jgi:recombinational DNA repair protein (RecF pathway)